MIYNKQLLINCFSRLLLSFAVLLLASCELIPEEDFRPRPTLAKGELDLKSELPETPIGSEIKRTTRFEAAPTTGVAGRPQAVKVESLFAPDEAATINLSLDGMPIPVFINEVFANQLKLDFQMAPEVANKEDLVTLRITDPRNRQQIFELARQVLSNYGVIIAQQGDLLRFMLGSSKGASAEPPLIITGEALPSVPATHRPVFLIRGMKVISNSDAYSMLRTVFQGQKLSVERDNSRNALTLQGSPDLVQSAADVIDLLDQPAMKGRYSLRIEPQFTDAESLSERLTVTMTAQGYDVGGTGKNTTLVPIKELNALFVFASDERTLGLIKQWVEQLDRVVSRSGEEESLYWYQVHNTGADQLAATLNAVIGGGGTGIGGSSLKDTKALGDQKSAVKASSHGNFVVDTVRNVLIYRGKAERWQEILPLIRDLDQVPPQVLVEVVVAEVALSEQFEFGVEWGLDRALAGTDGTLSSIFGGGVVGSGAGGNGLSWASTSSSGSTRLALNAFASDNKVSILQTPRVLVRSGQSATVNVGQSIPTLTSKSLTDEVVDGDSSVTQQISYREVGISLSVTPTVFSGGRIDLEVTQEVSQSVGDQSTVDLTPVISTRNITTSLSLQDGGSVLLGGLISKTQSKGNSRIPLLGDIPWLGQLFRVDKTAADDTELMILIVPYLVKRPQDAERLTKSFRDQMKLLPEPN